MQARGRHFMQLGKAEIRGRARPLLACPPCKHADSHASMPTHMQACRLMRVWLSACVHGCPDTCRSACLKK
eukprot:365696-Chlamydomonas_euryale.AAC.14